MPGRCTPHRTEAKSTTEARFTPRAGRVPETGDRDQTQREFFPSGSENEIAYRVRAADFWPSADWQKAIRAALEAVGVLEVPGYANVLDAPARNLSMGQQQRLSVARIMLDESEIMILDEPLAGVDVFTIRDLLPQLREFLIKRGHTVLMISHKLAFAAYADHVVVLSSDGRVREQGDPRTLLAAAGDFAKLHATSVEELHI